MVIIFVLLNSANLICRGTDVSKYFRKSPGLRDNESRLYYILSRRMDNFPPLFTRETTFGSFLFASVHTKPFLKGVCSERKEFPPMRGALSVGGGGVQISYHRVKPDTPFQKGCDK